MTVTPLVLSVCSLIIALCSLVVTFLNVPRTRKANLKNENEKFKRDLTRQTVDGLIEILFSLKEYLGKYRSLNFHFNRSYVHTVPVDESPFEVFNEELWKLIEEKYELLNKLNSYFDKREIIIKDYQGWITEIHIQVENVVNQIWEFKQSDFPFPLVFIENIDRKNCNEKLREITKEAEKIMIYIKDFQKTLQNNFYGSLFEKQL